jgi:glucose-fructose oxidoreductase
VLPAFAHARSNSRLAALVSGDPAKRKDLAERYGVEHVYDYEEYEACLERVDAVYIALPNHMHCDYTVRAARCGVHVLCEKPMAVTEKECETMIRAAQRHGVKLMIAYRLHFEEANLRAIEAVRDGKIGEPRAFNSSFTLQVVEPNIRLDPGKGGGTLYDIGVNCINAARYLFGEEPVCAQAVCAGSRGAVEEAASAVLCFPGGRLATFHCSFGASKVSAYQVIGTRGDLRLDSAYEYAGERRQRLTGEAGEKETRYARSDQFAPELVYFSGCVLQDREPEPSGEEGRADVRIIRALYRAARSGRSVKLEPLKRARRPSPEQHIRRPPVDKPQVIHARAPSGAR